MSAEKLNRQVLTELHLLASQKLLTYEQMKRIAERYPTSRWDLMVLIRWFTLIGAVAMGAGVLILVPKFVDWRNALDFGLGAATVGAIYGAHVLKTRKNMVKTAAALELLGAFAMQGLVVALAIRFSTGSDNWPALIGVCCILNGLLAYALRNRLILIDTLVNFFIWFGGETGYMSGWGAYWLGMTYPLRFVFAGLVTMGIAYGHVKWLQGALQGFSRVYLHFGLLVLNLALWFFALFGYFDDDRISWSNNTGQRLAFSALWALVAGASVIAGGRFGIRAMRGYGLTFLIINLYTFYFQFIAYESGELWFLHMLLVGGSMLGLGFWLEHRRSRKANEVSSVSAPS
jgi:hypothetical protein